MEEASSAARFIERMALSTMLPIPALRSAVSTFLASGGMRTLMAALAKKPSGRESLFELLVAPTVRASFKPAIISSLERTLPDFDLSKMAVAFLNNPDPGFCWA